MEELLGDLFKNVRGRDRLLLIHLGIALLLTTVVEYITYHTEYDVYEYFFKTMGLMSVGLVLSYFMRKTGIGKMLIIVVLIIFIYENASTVIDILNFYQSEDGAFFSNWTLIAGNLIFGFFFLVSTAKILYSYEGEIKETKSMKYENLLKLKKLLDANVITQEEFDREKDELLK